MINQALFDCTDIHPNACKGHRMIATHILEILDDKLVIRNILGDGMSAGFGLHGNIIILNSQSMLLTSHDSFWVSTHYNKISLYGAGWSLSGNTCE